MTEILTIRSKFVNKFLMGNQYEYLTIIPGHPKLSNPHHNVHLLYSGENYKALWTINGLSG
jgi:hypothetical protein